MRVVGLILCVLLAAVGCGDDASDSIDNTPVCVPDVASTCWCPTGAPGEKSCKDNGLSFGPCTCLPDAGAIDAGGGVDGGDVGASGSAAIDATAAQ